MLLAFENSPSRLMAFFPQNLRLLLEIFSTVLKLEILEGMNQKLLTVIKPTFFKFRKVKPYQMSGPKCKALLAANIFKFIRNVKTTSRNLPMQPVPYKQ
jgi:hypothetical protein